MAIRWNKTLVPTVKSALKRMASSGIQPSGVVLTQVDMKALSTYAYSDIDHNYRNYASYYQN
jgi:Mrp family chromosome partitioning ATPase